MDVERAVLLHANEDDDELLNDGNQVEAEIQADDPLLMEEESEADMSWYAAVFLVVNAALGAGLLNFPLSFHKSGGILPSVIMQVFLVILITASLLMYIYCTKIFKSQSYQDVVIALCGWKVGVSCGVLVIIYSFITNVTFLLVICDQWEKFIQLLNPSYVTNPPWYFDRRFFITISSFLLILPFSYTKKIDFLKYPSSLGVLVMVYLVFLVVVKYFTGIDGAKVGPVRAKPEHIYDIILDMPTICFGYQCHLNIVPIYQSTQGATKGHTFSKTIFASMIICFAVYTLFSIFGYLTFGSCVQADVLMCYVPTPEVLTAVVGVAIKMFVSYPLQLYVGRQVAEDLIMLLVAKKVDFTSKKSNNSNNTNNDVVDNSSMNSTNNNTNNDVVDNSSMSSTNNNTNTSNRNNISNFITSSTNNNILTTPTNNNNILPNNNTTTMSTKQRWEVVVRGVVVTLWFVASLFISLFVSDIDRVIPLLGAMAALFIFVYPGICMIRLLTTRPLLIDRPTFKTILIITSATILLIGVFIFGVTITNLFTDSTPASDLICA